MDFVFIYDNSGSMWSTFAKIDSNRGDTAFYHASGCLPLGGTGPIGTPFTYSTFTGPRTIQRLDSSVNCTAHAGDPYVARTAVISQAVDYLSARYPNSTAGAIAFAAVPDHAQPPLPLSVPGNAALVKASLGLDSIPSTNYLPPLTRATAWLRDASLIRNARQAMIFISDGEPTDASPFSAWLNANAGIPIHTIAFGDSSGPTFARMQEMSNRTGGLFYRVSPKDVPRMNLVMEEIIVRSFTVALAPRPARGPRARIGAFRPSVDVAGRRVPVIATPGVAAPGIRFPPPR